MGLRPLSWGYPGDAEPSPSPRVWFTTLGAPWQARGGKFHYSHKARGGSQQLLCSGLSGSSPSRCSRPGGQGREAALSYRHWHGCSPRINPGAPSSPRVRQGCLRLLLSSCGVAFRRLALRSNLRWVAVPAGWGWGTAAFPGAKKRHCQPPPHECLGALHPTHCPRECSSAPDAIGGHLPSARVPPFGLCRDP